MNPTSFPQRGAAVLVLLAAGLALVGGCQAKPVGYSDFDAETDFSGFRTFAFVPERTLVVASPNPPNPALEPTLKEEVQAYLTRRGFRVASSPADADFLVGFAVGGTPTLRTTAYTDSSRQVHIVGSATDLHAAVANQESTAAGLVIDVFAQPSGEKKWMGWTVQEITTGDLMRLRVTVRDLVATILQHFPPGG